MNGYVTYEEFGAKGDGYTCDLDAIAKAHEYANEKGLPVKANDNAIYYISEKHARVVIKTSVNFGNAVFIIDDVNPDEYGKNLFYVESDFETFEPEITSIKKGANHLDFPHEGRVYLRVFNDEHKVYIRKGLNQNAGVATSDCIVVDEDGNVETTVDWDYPVITRKYAKRVDDEPITIEGGRFITIANQHERVYHYHGRAFQITRSNVTFKGVTHLIRGEGENGAPYSGFISAQENVNLTVIDCLLTPRKTYETKDSVPGRVNRMGSYAISLGATVGTKLINVRQTRDILDTRYWGLMGSNFCKDVLVDGCEISRFDAHMGVSNATIRNSRVGHMCLLLIGFGEFTVENTFVLGFSFISLRGDYGSHFDGTVTIKNCTWKPNHKNDLYVIGAANQADHDFGYECRMPHKITIDGLTIDDSEINEESKIYLLPNYDGNFDPNAPFPYVPTKELYYSGVTTATGKAVIVYARADEYPDIKVVEG